MQMKKVLKAEWMGRKHTGKNISLEVIQMVLEEAEKRCDRTFVLKCNLTSYLTSRHQITSDKMSLPQWDTFGCGV